MERVKPKATRPKEKQEAAQGVPIYDTTPEKDKICPFKASHKERECLKNCIFNMAGHCMFAHERVGTEQEKNTLCPFFKRCAPKCAMNCGGKCGLAQTFKTLITFPERNKKI